MYNVTILSEWNDPSKQIMYVCRGTHITVNTYDTKRSVQIVFATPKFFNFHELKKLPNLQKSSAQEAMKE